MGRFIDRGELFNRLANVKDLGEAFGVIQGMEAAEVEEVVRCGECKYYLGLNERCELTSTRLRFYNEDKVWDEECFCSWGEKNE